MYILQSGKDEQERQRLHDELWRPPPGHRSEPPVPVARTVADLEAMAATLAADEH